METCALTYKSFTPQVVQEDANRTLIIESTPADKHGVYTIKVRAKTPMGNTLVDSEFSINLRIDDPCGPPSDVIPAVV